MFLVVPAEEVEGKDSGVLDRSEAVGEAWPILQGAELAFRVRVVVGDVGATVGLGDPEIAEEESYLLRSFTPLACFVSRELCHHFQLPSR